MKIYREVGKLPIVNREDAEGYARPVYSIEVEEAVPIEDYQSMEQTVDKLIKALAEAEPIRHGRWIKNDEYSDKIEGHIVYECSECGALYYWFDVPTHKYCRNCGAKMSEDKPTFRKLRMVEPTDKAVVLKKENPDGEETE